MSQHIAPMHAHKATFGSGNMSCLWKYTRSNESRLIYSIKRAMLQQAQPQHWWDIQGVQLLLQHQRHESDHDDIWVALMSQSNFEIISCKSTGIMHYRIKSNKKEFKLERLHKQRRARRHLLQDQQRQHLRELSLNSTMETVLH